MRRFSAFSLITFASLLLIYSCQKPLDAIEKIKKTCLYSAKIDYFKKWSNTYTEINLLNAAGAIQSRSVIYPYGYFQLNNDLTYNIVSDNVPLNGTWDITDSCQLVLDPGKLLQRTFDVVSLSNDSLVLHRKEGNTVYIQHYIAYNCPDVSKLEFQWDNVSTEEQSYSVTTLFDPIYIYPNGYFTLNADKSYNVLSDNVPLNGAWEINPTGCKLVLDKNTALERAFDIQQLTTDSLTIWRKDTVQRINYLQHYKKH